jgi:hypothetical protein
MLIIDNLGKSATSTYEGAAYSTKTATTSVTGPNVNFLVPQISSQTTGVSWSFNSSVGAVPDYTNFASFTVANGSTGNVAESMSTTTRKTSTYYEQTNGEGVVTGFTAYGELSTFPSSSYGRFSDVSTVDSYTYQVETSSKLTLKTSVDFYSFQVGPESYDSITKTRTVFPASASSVKAAAYVGGVLDQVFFTDAPNDRSYRANVAAILVASGTEKGVTSMAIPIATTDIETSEYWVGAGEEKTLIFEAPDAAFRYAEESETTTTSASYIATTGSIMSEPFSASFTRTTTAAGSPVAFLDESGGETWCWGFDLPAAPPSDAFWFFPCATYKSGIAFLPFESSPLGYFGGKPSAFEGIQVIPDDLFGASISGKTLLWTQVSQSSGSTIMQPSSAEISLSESFAPASPPPAITYTTTQAFSTTAFFGGEVKFSWSGILAATTYSGTGSSSTVSTYFNDDPFTPQTFSTSLATDQVMVISPRGWWANTASVDAVV